ncbi:MAG: hypothetical protein WD535_01580 [Thermaerobacterales bacterium]
MLKRAPTETQSPASSRIPFSNRRWILQEALARLKVIFLVIFLIRFTDAARAGSDSSRMWLLAAADHRLNAPYLIFIVSTALRARLWAAMAISGLSWV